MGIQYMGKEDAQRFSGYLAAAGYNIGTLAKELGMSRATLSSRIHGKTDFTRSEMEQISEKLNTAPEKIFFAA